MRDRLQNQGDRVAKNVDHGIVTHPQSESFAILGLSNMGKTGKVDIKELGIIVVTSHRGVIGGNLDVIHRYNLGEPHLLDYIVP